MTSTVEGLGPENLPFPAHEHRCCRIHNGNLIIEYPGDIIINPIDGIIKLDGGVCYNYHLLKDEDLQKNNLITISPPTISTSNTVTFDGTNLGLNPTNDYYNNDYKIKIIGGTGLGPTIYSISDYTYYDETKIEFEVSSDWIVPPDNTSIFEIFDSTFYLEKEHYYGEIETEHIKTVFLPNSEDCEGRTFILSYGINRPTDKWLYISPTQGTNDTIDTTHTYASQSLFLDTPNQRISLNSSGVDNWVIV